MEKKNIILYTPGNVNVKENTKVSFSNNSADVCLNKRSQEFYDAMNEQYNVVAWCCGKYGQHEYSRELGEAWCIFVQQFLAKVEKNKLPIDFAIQMFGHPVMVQPYPYFIFTDLIPWGDMSILDTVHFPLITKNYVHEQDKVYQNATGVMCFTPLSRYLTKNYHKVSSKRITTICTGINGHVQNNYLKNPEKLILWAGSNFEGKGGKELLQVFRKIRSVDPEYKLVFVGVDFEISEPGVRTYPFLHGTDLHILEELFEKAMVFVMPSFRECSGLVFFEAMARKTPIVVPTRGGMAEIVRRTGCGEIAIPGDVNSIYEAVMRVISDEQTYKRYSEAAYKFSIENTDWKIVADRIDNAITCWLDNKFEKIPVDYNLY